jgi:hypothetical protein
MRLTTNFRPFRLSAVVAGALALCLLAVGPAGAAPLPPADCGATGGFAVNYLNGVSNTWDQAFASRADLQTAYGNTHGGEPIEYHNLYNNTHGVALDVVEVFEQKVREAIETGILTVDQVNEMLTKLTSIAIEASTAPARLFAWFLSHVPIDQVQAVAEGLQDFLDDLPGWYEDAANTVNDWMSDQVSTFADWATLPAETRATIDSHVTIVRAQIASGKKPLIVSHSQGNLFANPEAAQVRDTVDHDNLGVVHVATPALLTSGPYVTTDTDLVIAPFFTAGQAPPPNVHMEPLLAGSNHGFGDAYLLTGQPPRALLLSTISQTLDGITVSNESGSDGLFTVTLTWAGAGDVDLHVVEPNGQHVYYGAQAGSLGYLDVDNTSADGPEHYFAACDSDALTGTFLVGVTNYAAPTDVPIQVQLASRSFTGPVVSVPIGASTFSAGIGTNLFRVQVGRDENGRIQVQQLPA